MANDQTVAPVIIKRKKIIAADGHHGGAWKVAYADFETFLKILIAQIQNQGSINPIDSRDYTTQLATFSSVDQQVLANSYLENI